MVKRLHLLFLMSLLGTACMTGSESNIATEKPKEIKGNAIPKTEQRHVSQKKIDPPTITLKKDITNHPVLWMLGSSLFSVFIQFWVVYFSTDAYFVLLQEQPMVRKYRLIPDKLVSMYMYSLIPYIALSLLTASWASRWGHEGQKGEDSILPSFKARFWRSFRFISSLSLLTPIVVFILHFCGVDDFNDISLFFIWDFSPFIIAILSYVGIRLYDAKKRQKQETKPIPKKNPVLDPQDKSLDVMKPLVA